MRKTLIIISIIALVNVVGIIMFMPDSPLKKKVIHIALVGPMSGQSKGNGLEMVRGVNLCLDKIREEGKFKHADLEVIRFDDKDKKTAIKIATLIANNNKALLVLGHYGSTGSTAAGTIYKKSGIPAITGSATAPAVTLENDWYFRVVPENSVMSVFTANYMIKALNKETSSIIYKDEPYSKSLLKTFKSTALDLGISIENEWISTAGDLKNQGLRNIIGRLRSSKDPGMIFCATHASEGVEFFAASKYPGTNYSVIGPDSFATPAFIDQFKHYARERESPGYYSDGIYAVAPFIADTAGEIGLEFKREFVAKYGMEPSWIAACYYDAMRVAHKAIIKAEVKGEDIRKDRKRVKEALGRINTSDVSISGVTGDIYFDKNGNYEGSIAVGVWRKQKLLPAFWQYQDMHSGLSTILPQKDSGKTFAGILKKAIPKDESIELADRLMIKTRVVYTGFDINKIYNFDMEKGTCDLDFYVWFRFYGAFDSTRVQFLNSVNPVELGEPVMEETTEDYTVRLYRVVAQFKVDFDTFAYPLDTQSIRIDFRHSDKLKTKLLYVPDYVELSRVGLLPFKKKEFGERSIKPIAGWDITDISLFQDILKQPGPGKLTLSYSRFNVDIQMRRQNLQSLFIKALFPIVVILALLWIVYFIPHDNLSTRAMILVPLLAVLGGMQFSPYRTTPIYGIIGYSYLAGYLIVGISLIMSILTVLLHKWIGVTLAGFFIRTEKIAHITLCAAACSLIGYFYISY